MPTEIAATITRISQVLTSGMSTAFVGTAGGALVALLTRRPAEEDTTPSANEAAAGAVAADVRS